MKAFILVGVLMAPALSHAAIYKCVTSDGRTRFQGVPCKGVVSKEVDIYVAPDQSNDGPNLGSLRSKQWYLEQAQRREAERKEAEERLERTRAAAAAKNKQDSRLKSLVRENRLAVGMTKEQALESWGKPCDVNRSIYSSGVHEQWVYCRGDYERDYIYFDDGKLSAIQLD